MDEKEVKKERNLKILKICVNLLVALCVSCAGLLFCAYGLACKGLPFIEKNFKLLLYLSCGAFVLSFALYALFYFLKKRSLYRLVLCTLICLLFFAVIFFVASRTGIISKFTSVEELRDYIKQFGTTAALIFVLFQFLQVVILPVPGSVSVAAGVALFGALRCSFFSLIGILSGSFAAFFIGRLIGYRAVCWIVGKEELDKWLKKIKGKDYLILSIMFLLPMFPDDMLCFVAGLSSMTNRYFAVMIIITRVLSVFTTAYSFELIPFNTWWGILIWVIIFLAIAALFVIVCKYSDKIDAFLKRKFGRKRKNKNKEEG